METGPENGQREQPWDLAAGEGAAFSPLRNLIRISYRYRLVIISCWFFGVLLSLPFALMIPKRYTAFGLLSFGGAMSAVNSSVYEHVRELYMSEFFAKNQMGILESYELADFVLSKPENADIRERLARKSDDRGMEASRKLGYKQSTLLLERYVKDVQNLRIPTTLTVKLWATATDPAIAARMVNAHATAFIEFVKDRERAELIKVADHLDSELSALVPELERASKDVEESIRKSPYPELIGNAVSLGYNPPLGSGYMYDQYARTASERTLLEGAGLESSHGEASRLFDSSNVYDQLLKIGELESEYEALKMKLSPKHPELRDLRARIAGLQKSIHEQRADRLSDLKYDGTVKKLSESAILELLKRSRGELVEGLAARLEADGPVQRYIRLRAIQNAAADSSRIFRMIANRDILRLDLVNPAIPPSAPTGVPGSIFLLVGCFVGPIVGCGIAFILHATDHSIDSAEDVAALGLDFLGTIPRIDLPPNDPRPSAPDQSPASESEGTRVKVKTSVDDAPPEHTRFGQTIFGHTLMGMIAHSPWRERMFASSMRHSIGMRIHSLTDPNAPFTEAIRTIRTALVTGTKTSRARRILFSSASAEEGKTTIAVGMACAFAQIGFKTLLIDTNLRSPMVNRTLGIPITQPGLADYLADRAPQDQIVAQTTFKDLNAIVATTSMESPVDLLSNRKFQELLELASDNYHFIILDSSPILGFGDTRLVAQWVDEVVLVAHHRVTERPSLKRAVRILRSLGCRISGVILNGVEASEAVEIES